MRTLFLASTLLCMPACAGAPPQEGRDDGAAVTCATDEIAFTMEEGCLNDGSVEVCLPAEADDALERARAIAPTISCSQGSRGRAGCDPASQLLCLVPLGAAECVAPHGALTTEGWQMVCALAAMPEVTRVVHTFYE